jgi:glycosyltransferase involved in cell wall biosynthesis
LCRAVELEDKDKPRLSAFEGQADAAPIRINVLYRERNRGKGGALRTGFAHATGEVVVIRDADVEYDPDDWDRMYRLIVERAVAAATLAQNFLFGVVTVVGLSLMSLSSVSGFARR